MNMPFTRMHSAFYIWHGGNLESNFLFFHLLMRRTTEREGERGKTSVSLPNQRFSGFKLHLSDNLWIYDILSSIFCSFSLFFAAAVAVAAMTRKQHWTRIWSVEPESIVLNGFVWVHVRSWICLCFFATVRRPFSGDSILIKTELICPSDLGRSGSESSNKIFERNWRDVKANGFLFSDGRRKDLIWSDLFCIIWK